MTFQSLLPANATQEELAQEMVHSHVGDVLFDIRDVKNPDQCPADILPWLAWEYAITYWDENWSEQQQRDAIKNAAVVNKTRGTPGAVMRALTQQPVPVTVIEWFNDTPVREPYTFRLQINSDVMQSDYERITSLVLDAKNARSLLGEIDIVPEPVTGNIILAGYVLSAERIIQFPVPPPMLTESGENLLTEDGDQLLTETGKALPQQNNRSHS